MSLIGNHPSIAALREQIERLAQFDRPGNANAPTLLIRGETGTGKGLVARLVHDSGARAGGPFVDVNCAAIPETMLEAELFGFEAGAFTDARRAKPGLFEAASGGTLFLDEIDALPLALQGKLLKAIEEKDIRRLGAVVARTVDTRLLAATQRDLREMVASRAFRADLFHRLAVVVLDLPPLRARGDDIALLADHFCAQHARAHGLEPRRPSPAARRWLGAQGWPGNVRELSHLIERATLLCPEIEIQPDAFERLRVPFDPPTAAAFPSAAASPAPDDDEAARVRDALRRAGGNVVRAAKLLGIGRNALRGRMSRLGIERPTLADLAAAPKPARARRPAAPVETPVGAPSWEQKPVAVLAVDLVLPAEAPEPWTVARRWQDGIEECVAGFGGVFLPRRPSRLTAVFGIPRALEQLPQRAVQAALAVQRLAAEEPAERRPELRMALHAGVVHVDTGARDTLATLLAVGDTVALPERLLGHAGAGEILCSTQLARRIEAVCELEARALRVGEGETLRAAAVLGQRPRAGAAAEPGQSRFTGRAREVAVLREAFDSAVRGDGQVALVVGEPGIGKSRLLAEFRSQVEGERHLWVEGRCASYATTAAFHAVTDGLRRFLGIDERDDATSAGAKVERGVLGLDPSLGWTLPLVRHLLALDAGDAAVAALDSASRRSETFRALKAITRAAAERQPVVVVVEDLHWIDPASEDYLAFLADTVPGTRMLLVCSYRPGYRHPFGDRSYQVRLSLRALSSDEVTAVTQSLLGTAEVPPAVRDLIAAKAEGNPFFVEEVTRSLLEDGSLRCEGGRAVLARDLAEITVPDTIQDVLIARIDRLADDARRAIQVASVIGREFALRLLARISEAGDGVQSQVDELRAVELIYEKATHPELAFMFKHALTHDVAYESVLLERRKQLHRTIGLAIEELYADRLAELYETLAHHFERGEDWARAFDYHERAAAKAAETFANRAVIAHCRAALAIAPRLALPDDDPRCAQLEEGLGFASFFASEFNTSGDAFRRAAERHTAPAPRAVALSRAGFSYFWAHGYAASEETLEAALAIARREGLPGAEARALGVRGWHVGVLRGEIAEYERLLLESERLARSAGDEEAIATARFSLAQTAEWTGDYRRAIGLAESVLATGRRYRLPHLVAWPKWFLGKAWCCLGNYGRAIAELTEAAEVCDRIGDRAWTSRLFNTLGWCFAEIGDGERARSYDTHAADLARAIGDPEIVANSEINLVRDWLALGEVERAAETLDPIRAALARGSDPWMRWRYGLHVLEATARVARACGRPEEALAAADEEIVGARRYRAPKIEVHALATRGDALLALERREEAEAALGAAAALAEQIAYPRGVWTALGRLAEAKRQAGLTAEAEALAARRRRLVEQAVATLRDASVARSLLA